MEEWKEVRLGDIIRIKSGLPYKGEYLNKGNNYLLGMGCVSFSEIFLTNGARRYADEGKPQYVGKPGDIVLATRQQSDNLPILGMPAMIPDSFGKDKIIVGSNLYMVENNSEIDNHFLFWLLKSPKYINHIKYSQTGTTVRMITKKDIENFTFLCPSKQKQNFISRLLWNIQVKIETNRKINARLEELAQAIFKSWFIDFEPFGGKMPADWKEIDLKEFVKLECGFPFKSETYTDNGKYELVTIKAVQDGFLDLQGANKINDIPERMPSYCFLQQGDILLSLTGNVGRICIVNRGEVLLNQRVAKLSSKNEQDSSFSYFLFRQESFKKSLIAMANGTAQLNLSPLAIGNIRLNIPTRDVLNQFANATSCILDKKVHIEQESSRLAALRDTLLPKLMSGEIEPGINLITPDIADYT